MQVLRSPHGHEVVYGTTGSGKTTKARELLEQDYANDREVWVIAPIGGVSLPDWRDKATRFASKVDEAQALLADLAARAHHGIDRPVSLTIDTAIHVLSDRSCRWLLEQVIGQARGHDVRVRLVLNTLHLDSFGGSAPIRTALLDDAVPVAS